MASEPLVDTYKRYKAGTSKLVQFLSESAPRLDHHAPIAAKKSSPHKVSTDDLVVFAQRIVDSKDPIIDITIDILDITKDAISGRSLAARWYAALAEDTSSSTDPSLRAANESHQYFLTVLEQVFEILWQEHKGRRTKRKEQVPALASDTNDLTNLYQHLELEETTTGDDHPTGKPSQKPKKISSKTKSSQTYELDNDEEDKLFEIWCLLSDLSKVKLYARSVWTTYNKGSISLIVACKMTENAIIMSYSLSTAFLGRHEDLAQFPQILDFIGAHSYRSGVKHKPKCYDLQHLKAPEGKKHSADVWNDLLCVDAWQSLTEFSALQRCVWMSDVELRKTYASKEHLLESLSHPFSRALVSIAFEFKSAFPELALYMTDDSIMTPSHPICNSLDPYTISLIFFARTRIIDAGQVAATQIYLEMYEALNGDQSRAFREFSVLLQNAKHSRIHVSAANHSHGEGFNKNAPLSSPGQNDEGVNGWMVPASVSQSSLQFLPESLLSALPILACQHTYTTMFVHQISGQGGLEFSDSFTNAAYIYKAAQLAGSVAIPWDDMDFFLGRQAAFVNSPWSEDRTMRSVVNRFGIGLGLSVTQIRGPKVPKLPTPAHVFKVRVRPALPCRYMVEYWAALNDHATMGVEVSMRMFYKLVNVRANSKGGMTDKIIAEQWKETKTLSPVQLLQVAQEVLIEDDPYFHFDYYDFSEQCAQVIRLANTCFFTEAHQKAGRSLVTHPFNYSVIHSVLWDAAMVEMRGISMKNTTLHTIGTLANVLIKDNEWNCAARALEVSSKQ